MSWSDLPPLGALVPFEAAVRLGSVTRAAAELHVTHGAISRQLQALERFLGVELFHREGRGIAATEVAQELHRQVAHVLGQLSFAVTQARPGDVRRPLVLSCEPTLLMRWLLPRLPVLQHEHPDLELHLSAAGGSVDLYGGGIDVAIRRLDFSPGPSLRVDEIFEERIGPVCDPRTARLLTRTSDLGGHRRLTTESRRSAWTDWAALERTDLPAAVEVSFEHFYLSLEAAAAGLGVAIGPHVLVENDLAAGRLVAPFGFVRDRRSYVFISRAGATDPRVEVVREWLRVQASVAALSGADGSTR